MNTVPKLLDECPECGEELEADDQFYMDSHNCCKCCYDDHHFGEEAE